MKRWAGILGLAVLALGIGYWVAGQRHGDEVGMLEEVRGSNLSWLQAEFKLSDEQFAAVRAVHEGYAEICSQHCTDIIAAQGNLAEARARDPDSATAAAAERRLRELEDICNNATQAHVQKVAELMPPAAGRRFLALVEPHLAAQPHDGDRGLHR